MRKWSVLVYGVICYVSFLATFLYLAGWLGDMFVPNSIDAATDRPWGNALLVNVLLVLLFGVQHSVMARPTFKQWWTKYIPWPIERSTYVLFTNLALWVLFWQWQPMGVVVWDVSHPWGRAALYGLCALGWLAVLVTTFLINHFDLFGLRQVWLYFLGRPYTPLGFVTPGPYRLIRHPLYIGWMTAFWATPTMTIAHLVFAVGTTAYMLIAIGLEERNLLQFYGDAYSRYRSQTPMLVPFSKSPPPRDVEPIAQAVETVARHV